MMILLCHMLSITLYCWGWSGETEDSSNVLFIEHSPQLAGKEFAQSYYNIIVS